MFLSLMSHYVLFMTEPDDKWQKNLCFYTLKMEA